MAEEDVFRDLQDWYAAQCDGQWEEDNAVTIETLDNPGWALKINLSDTWLEKKAFEPVHIDNSDDDWLHATVRDQQFEAYGDPQKLTDMVRVFIQWARSVTDWLSAPPWEPSGLRERLSNQGMWSLLGKSNEKERCQSANCDRRRISYSVFCLQHHFDQLKRPLPQEVAEMYVYGDLDRLQQVKAMVVERIKEVYGDGSIGIIDGGMTLILEWLRRDIVLMVVDETEELAFRIAVDKNSSMGAAADGAILTLFCREIVEPAVEAFGGVSIAINVWSDPHLVV